MVRTFVNIRIRPPLTLSVFCLGHFRVNCCEIQKRRSFLSQAMSKKCCVCGDSKDTTENVLYTCQGHGCDVIVHQGRVF